MLRVVIPVLKKCLIVHLFFIFQVLGTPTREQIREMNPNYTEFKFPQIKAHPWTKVSLFEMVVCVCVAGLIQH